VVFAPTIMRPKSIRCEYSDSLARQKALQTMLEHIEIIFINN